MGVESVKTGNFRQRDIFYRCLMDGQTPCIDHIFSYSVTQSYSNSLLGDVVFDSFNKVYRDDDNILDQTYQKQVCLDFYHDFHKIIRKCILTLE